MNSMSQFHHMIDIGHGIFTLYEYCKCKFMVTRLTKLKLKYETINIIPNNITVYGTV